MNNPPAFQFYAKDFLTSFNVQIMTAEQVGIYMVLKAHSWIQEKPCYLLNNDQALQMLSRVDAETWKKNKEVVLNNFKKKGDYLYCDELLEYYKELMKKRKSLSANGKKGGRPKNPPKTKPKANKKQLVNSGKADESTSTSLSVPSSTALKKPVLKPCTTGLDKSNNDGKPSPKSTRWKAIAAIVDANKHAFKPSNKESYWACKDMIAALVADPVVNMDEETIRAFYLQCMNPKSGTRKKYTGWFISVLDDFDSSPADWATKRAKREIIDRQTNMSADALKLINNLGNKLKA